MVGTIVNAAAIVLGTMIGLLFKKGMPERVRNTIMQGIGLAVLLIGLQMSIQSKEILVVVASLVLGGLTGELVNIEGWLARLGRWVDVSVGGMAGEAGKAFVMTSLIYCVGAMAIMGSLEAVLEMSATGGLLIVGIGINILGIKEIRVGNLLPAIFYALPLVYWLPYFMPG
ncbi:MAG: DUF554 domain-containing protein [Peptococcaceae bacterium]|nr:DUF554 domain-containing protein [Candidatus Syntrophopropionicum ammoniitolerans]